MGTILHPDSGIAIKGERIKKGERIQENDVYASTTGKWERCPFHPANVLLQTDHVVWVRPAQAVETEEKLTVAFDEKGPGVHPVF